MKKTHEEIDTRRRDVLDSITCDRCGEECLHDSGAPIAGQRSGTEFKGSFGYGSDFDTSDWTFDLCDKCCRWLRDQLLQIETRDW